MESVKVAELKNRLSKRFKFSRGGQQEVIRDANLPMANLVPLLAEVADD